MRNNKGQFMKGSRPDNYIGLTRMCLLCGIEFQTKPARVKVGRGKYCSKKCANKARLGIKPVYSFPTGSIPWNKGLTKETDLRVADVARKVSGENNGHWTGEEANYISKHNRVKKHRGKASEYDCARKDNTCKGFMQWASISHNASTDINDYMPLCISHHVRYDRKKIKLHPPNSLHLSVS